MVDERERESRLGRDACRSQRNHRAGFEDAEVSGRGGQEKGQVDGQEDHAPDGGMNCDPERAQAEAHEGQVDGVGKK